MQKCNKGHHIQRLLKLLQQFRESRKHIKALSQHRCQPFERRTIYATMMRTNQKWRPLGASHLRKSTTMDIQRVIETYQKQKHGNDGPQRQQSEGDRNDQ